MVYYRRAGIGQYSIHLLQALAALPPAEAADLRMTVLQVAKTRCRLCRMTRFRRRALITPCHHRQEQAGLAAELRTLRPRPAVLHSPDFTAVPTPLPGGDHRPRPGLPALPRSADRRERALLRPDRARGDERRGDHRRLAEYRRRPSGAGGRGSAKIRVVYEAADPRFAPPPAGAGRSPATSCLSAPSSRARISLRCWRHTVCCWMEAGSRSRPICGSEAAGAG